MMKRFGLWVAVVVAIALFAAASGCGTPTPSVTNKTALVSVSAGVQVLDVFNNTVVNGVPVYFAACSPNRTDNRAFQASAVTGDDGWALFATNFTLDEGETIYLGASDIKPMVDADLAAGSFNGTGQLGGWKAFGYNLLQNGEGNGTAIVGCVITVSRDSGKII